ncbi:hypothetical protein [Aureispira anguillae]|uniref:Uncharacterized protein n=1 Tax=Aureispira anguillae TaxID=2864201 RepID=A0A915YD99_9BACT|nr:hypothetical protein [Aureispira anguillae]BDS10948.1 hypothetical protein AsAng_0016580 [Aureispira anguillae]
MAVETQNINKANVAKDIHHLLNGAELWALLRTDKNGFVHVHTDSETDFMALVLCIFKDRPDLKDDLDMMLKFEKNITP